MPVERENGSARQASRSAARRAPAYARNEETGGRGKGGKDAPERQATPASSGTKMQGGWKEGSRGELRLAEMRRARGLLSFGRLFEDQTIFPWELTLQRGFSDSPNVVERWRNAILPTRDRRLGHTGDFSHLGLGDPEHFCSDKLQRAHARIICANGLSASGFYPGTDFSSSPSRLSVTP